MSVTVVNCKKYLCALLHLAYEYYQLYDIYEVQGNRYMANDIAQILTTSLKVAEYLKKYVTGELGSVPFNNLDDNILEYCSSVTAYLNSPQFCRIMRNDARIKCTPVSVNTLMRVLNIYNRFISMMDSDAINLVNDEIGRLGCYVNAT